MRILAVSLYQFGVVPFLFFTTRARLLEKRHQACPTALCWFQQGCVSGTGGFQRAAKQQQLPHPSSDCHYWVFLLWVYAPHFYCHEMREGVMCQTNTLQQQATKMKFRHQVMRYSTENQSKAHNREQALLSAYSPK